MQTAQLAEGHSLSARTCQRLQKLAAEVGDVRLIIIDPVSAYMGSAEQSQDSDVRSSLAPACRHLPPRLVPACS